MPEDTKGAPLSAPLAYTCKPWLPLCPLQAPLSALLASDALLSATSPCLFPSLPSLLYALRSAAAPAPFQIDCVAADQSKLCAGHVHCSQQGWQRLQVLCLVGQLTSRSSYLSPSLHPSLLLIFFVVETWIPRNAACLIA